MARVGYRNHLRTSELRSRYAGARKGFVGTRLIKGGTGVLLAIATAVTAAGGAYTAMGRPFSTEPCRISGLTVNASSKRPLGAAQIGWSPDRHKVSLTELSKVDFRILAYSAPDGRYAGECDHASDNDGTFEVLTRGEPARNPKRPKCSRIGYTGLIVRNEGKHEGVTVPVIGC